MFRSHQLRLHLQFLGNPIANDPCYGGKLFYEEFASNREGGSVSKRQEAKKMLQVVRRLNLETLTRLKHLVEDLGGDEALNEDSATSTTDSNHGDESDDKILRELMDGGLSNQLRNLEDEHVRQNLLLNASNSNSNSSASASASSTISTQDAEAKKVDYSSYKKINATSGSVFREDHFKVLDTVRGNCK